MTSTTFFLVSHYSPFNFMLDMFPSISIDSDIVISIPPISACWFLPFLIPIIIVLLWPNRVIDVQFGLHARVFQGNGVYLRDTYCIWDLNDGTCSLLSSLLPSSSYTVREGPVWNPSTHSYQTRTVLVLNYDRNFAFRHTPWPQHGQILPPFTPVMLEIPVSQHTHATYSVYWLFEIEVNNNGIPLAYSYNILNNTVTIRGVVQQVV